MMRSSPVLPAKCSGIVRPIRCDNTPPLPAKCAEHPSAFVPWVSLCYVYGDCPFEVRWDAPACAEISSTQPWRAWGGPVPQQPWRDAAKTMSYHSPSLAVWCGAGGGGDPNLSDAEMLAWLNDGTEPAGSWQPCANCAKTLTGADRYFRPSVPGIYAPELFIRIPVCWVQDTLQAKMRGWGQVKLWRFVWIEQREFFSHGGAYEPCCADSGSELTLRPGVNVRPSTPFYVTYRQGPALPLFRELECTGTVTVEWEVPGIYNNGAEFASAWNSYSVLAATVCVVTLNLPVVTRRYEEYFMASRRSGDDSYVWQPIRMRLGGNRVHRLTLAEGFAGFVAPIEEATFSASGLSPAQSDTMGCLHWYPQGTPPSEANGVWVTENIPMFADMFYPVIP